MLYEITGTDSNWMMVHAQSPAEAIEQFEAHCPSSTFLSIQEVRSAFEAVSISGERVMITNQKYLTCWNRRKTRKTLVLHYETNLEKGSWIPATEFRALEATAA